MGKNTGEGYRIGSVCDRYQKEENGGFQSYNATTGDPVGGKTEQKHKGVAMYEDKRRKSQSWCNIL